MSKKNNENCIDLVVDGETIYRITVESPSGKANADDITEFIEMLQIKVFGMLKEIGIKSDLDGAH